MNDTIEKKNLGTKIQTALDKAVKKIVEEQKKNNGYVIVADKDRNIKKILAKDL